MPTTSGRHIVVFFITFRQLPAAWIPVPAFGAAAAGKVAAAVCGASSPSGDVTPPNVTACSRRPRLLGIACDEMPFFSIGLTGD